MKSRPSLSLAGLFGVLTCAAVLSAGCNLLRLNQVIQEQQPAKPAGPGVPEKTSFRVSQYLFYADFEVDRNLPIFKELSLLRDQVYKELQLPNSSTLVQVYLFEDRERYESFMKDKYPYLPKRRAFFVAQPRAIGNTEDLLVYTYWGDKIQQDLRHELTHALLHSVLKDVPLWLDEGLAEYFETPRGWSGINYQHLDYLRRGPGERFQPNLAYLEQLKDVQQMNQKEYREAWAWVHLMLRGNPKARQVLVAYMNELRTNNRPGLLQPRLQAVLPSPDDALVRHLAEIDATKPRATTAQR